MPKTKQTKYADLANFQHVIQLSYADVGAKDFYLKNSWNSSYFKNNHKIILEIGCGKGEYTIALAEKYPNLNLIGVDIKGARIWKGATILAKKKLQNVCFLRTQAAFLQNIFAENEISEIWLPFPDPQMKKYRKRLLSVRFLNVYQKILSDNGKIHIKTDSNYLFTYIKALLLKNKIKPNYMISDIHDKTSIDDNLLVETYYEKQFIEMGIPIKYIQFKLPKQNLFEPNIKIQAGKLEKLSKAKNHVTRDVRLC